MPNRLADSRSLYLRKHADNPIDWWPWIPEALETACQDDRPIFLSIGYSSCHWCTVMEGEAFSNAAIAEFMNRNFIPIKVDREERPDIDSIYMQSLQLMVGQGGWPLNVFLTPEDLVPFYAGTYFPVEPRFGRPGFLEVLQRIRQFYDREKTKIEKHKSQLLEVLTTISHLTPEPVIPPERLTQGIQAIIPVVSSGGSRQQFPMMPYAQLVLQSTRLFKTGGPEAPDLENEIDLQNRDPGSSPNKESNDQETREVSESVELGLTALPRARQRGMDLVLGGIFDHVGGGFHRYTVDPTWTVPHFEKMLYDNGQILEFLSDLWAHGVQDPAIERAITLTVGWLKREMTAPEGYFYAAQDADSFAKSEDVEPEEGDFYLWQQEALQDVLTGQEFEELEKAFYLSVQGNFSDRPGYIVLQRRQGGTLGPLVEKGLQEKLFAIRYGDVDVQTFPPARTAQDAKGSDWPGRIPPVTDTKMILAWNSLMISGLSRAFQVFGVAEYLEMALRAAQFILHAQQPQGSLLRLNYDGVADIPAKSEDYALLVKALLDLHQASLPLVGAPSAEYWLDQAIRLQRQMDEALWDSEMGGYFVSDAANSQDLLVREKEFQDHATPAANGIAVANLVRLSSITGQLDYLDRAEQGLKLFGETMATQPRLCPSLFAALDWYQNYLKVAVVPEILQEFQQHSWPTTTFVLPSDRDPVPPGSIGLACVGLKCLDPADVVDQLRVQMQKGQTRVS